MNVTRLSRRRLPCLILIGLGLVVSGYLLARSLALLSNLAPGGIDVCSVVFGSGCDLALLSATSWKLGVPLAGWGVVYYATIACLLILAWVMGEAFQRQATLAALLLAAAGAAVSVVLAAVTVAGKAPFCPLCLVVHAVNLALVLALWRLTGLGAGQLLCSLRAGARYALGGQTDAGADAPWKVLGLVTAALVAIVLYQWVLVQSERSLAGQGRFDPHQTLAGFESTPQQDIPINGDDARLGPPDAAVQLVVFSSFQCPGCRTIAGELRHLSEHFPGKLAVIFKHYPLGTACNPAVKVDKHPNACEAACAAEAARRQGAFWRFHDSLFASDLTESAAAIDQIVREIGLDRDRFEAERKAEATMAKIRSDAELGGSIGVDATPALFLNGRRLRHLSAESIELLVAQQLRSPETYQATSR